MTNTGWPYVIVQILLICQQNFNVWFGEFYYKIKILLNVRKFITENLWTNLIISASDYRKLYIYAKCLLSHKKYNRLLRKHHVHILILSSFYIVGVLKFSSY